MWRRPQEEADICGDVPEKDTLIEWPLYAPAQLVFIALKSPVAPVVVELAVANRVMYFLLPSSFEILKDQLRDGAGREARIHALVLVQKVLAPRLSGNPHHVAVIFVADKVFCEVILSDRLWPVFLINLQYE